MIRTLIHELAHLTRHLAQSVAIRPFLSTWKMIARFGCLARFMAMVRIFNDAMLAWAYIDGDYSEPFPVTNGVKQGSVHRQASKSFSGL